MNRKNLTAILLGVLAAALIFVIAGLIIYLPATHIVLNKAAENYAKLNAARSRRLILGMVLIWVGSATATLPTIALLVILIIYIINKIKNN
jgi:hypothetical protein